MGYWQNIKKNIEKELYENHKLLSEWRKELSFAQTPDKRKQCNFKIQELEKIIFSLEEKLLDIQKKTKIDEDELEFQISEIDFKDILQDKSKRKEDVKKQTPYKHGVIIRRDTGGYGSKYIIEDTNKEHFECIFADVLTEGFRSLRIGDEVRFVAKYADKNYATYVIKLNEDYSYLYY